MGEAWAILFLQDPIEAYSSNEEGTGWRLRCQVSVLGEKSVRHMYLKPQDLFATEPLATEEAERRNNTIEGANVSPGSE